MDGISSLSGCDGGNWSISFLSLLLLLLLPSSLLFDCDDDAVGPSGDGGVAPAKDEVVGVDMRMMKRIRMMCTVLCFIVLRFHHSIMQSLLLLEK